MRPFPRPPPQMTSLSSALLQYSGLSDLVLQVCKLPAGTICEHMVQFVNRSLCRGVHMCLDTIATAIIF